MKRKWEKNRNDAWKKVKEAGLLLLFPKRCPVCDGVPGTRGELICPQCRDKLKPIRHAFCYKCGRPLSGDTEEYCEDCRRKNHFFDGGRALYVYEEVAGSIYRFKYAKRQEYACFFGGEMAEKLGDFIQKTGAEAFIPVPLSARRMYKRGYNQAQLLAEEISCRTGVPVYNDFVVRIRDTVAQKGLNPSQRQNNLKRAFKITRNDVKLNTIIIIDDIYTTGSTVDAVAKLLRKAGVQKIYVMVLSITAGR